MNPAKDKIASCNICMKSYTRRASLNIHMRIHTGERPYLCKICNKTFERSSHLRTHEILHSGKKPFNCEVCKRQFTQASNFRTHVLLMHIAPKKSRKREIPPDQIKPNAELNSRTKPDLGYRGGFVCVFCDGLFIGREALDRHIFSHIKEHPHFCKLCPVECCTKYVLKSHLKTHGSARQLNFECDLCLKKFSNNSHLQQHIRTHLAEKAYKCNICGKAFPGPNNLQHHRKVHSQEKPFRCDKCGMGFKSNRNLKRHILGVHDKLQPYSCPVCSKCFSEKSSMKQHITYIHTMEKPFKCEICKKECKTAGDFKKHSRVHQRKN